MLLYYMKGLFWSTGPKTRILGCLDLYGFFNGFVVGFHSSGLGTGKLDAGGADGLGDLAALGISDEAQRGLVALFDLIDHSVSVHEFGYIEF